MKPLTDLDLNTQLTAELSPDAEVERRETAGEILRLVATLPFNQQEVVRLKFQNGLSYQEISAITSLTVTNVGFLLHTAIKNLRRDLQPASNVAALSLRKKL